jgi:hypothetical protein
MAKSPKIAAVRSHKGDASTIIPKQTREKKYKLNGDAKQKIKLNSDVL